MVHEHKKKPLYEVIAESRAKQNYEKIAQQAHAQKIVEKESLEKKTPVPITKKPAQWPTRPRALQINAGRVEISLPYQLVIAIVLGVVLLIVVAFRLGQTSYRRNSAVPTAGTVKPVPSLPKPPVSSTIPAIPMDNKTTSTLGVGSTGDHIIVLVEYPVKADLIPVREHFAEYGIDTVIARENNRYFLITKNTYQNPEKAGTDGYQIKKKIIEAGAAYKGKAPQGYESFAPHFFRDAYGRKIK